MGKLKEQAQFVDNSTAQNQLYMTQIKELETRVQNLIDKVQEQADTVDRSNEKEHSYVQEKQKQKAIIKSLESEMQHLKTTKVIDSLAPKSIYSGKATHDAKSEEDSKKTETIPKLEFTVPQPQFPKLSTYDGTSDWKSYHLQFVHTATRFEWGELQKLDNFLMCLRGKALKYFSTRPTSVQRDFDTLVDKMAQRFGDKDLPHSIRRQLQDVKQTIEESIEDYAERVQEMATEGYVEASEDIVEMMATEAFLRDCQNNQAALLAMDKDPKRIDLALQYVKSAIHNRKVLLGQKKTEVRKVQFQEEIASKSDSEPTVKSQ